MSLELCGWSVNFWDLWWSSSVSNNSPTTSFFSLLPTFVYCSIYLVYLLSMTVKFLITSIKLSMVTCWFISSSLNKEISFAECAYKLMTVTISLCTFFATVTSKSSLVPTPESTHSGDDTSPVCVSILTYSLGGSRVIHWRLWLIILCRASIFSLMIYKSCPKSWGHEGELLGNWL